MVNAVDGNGSNNTHRSLKRLVVVDAWFVKNGDDNLYTLHADVIFNEERLGGGSDAKIVFRIAVLRCEVVFVRPHSDFSVNRASIRRQAPRPQQEVKSTNSKRSKLSLGGMLSLSGVNAQAAGGHEVEKQETSSSEVRKGVYGEQFTKSSEGHDAWKLDGSQLPNGRLDGPVFDPINEPRLTLRDLRSEEQRTKDEKNSLHPVSRIEIRCLREDIDIYDIRFKNEDRNQVFGYQNGRREKLTIARSLLREALLQESLSVGDMLNDPFAEMTLCDVTIPIIG